MKHKIVINQIVIITAALFSALCYSCGRVAEESPTLTAIDSLLATAPDSALTCLLAIDPDTLTGDRAANRAYHALLTAQGRFLNGVLPAPTDTIAIDRAAEYYAGTPREARALIYAGTTREDLGDLTGAMRQYKCAETAATAAADTFHTAYALMRMAWLYHEQFAAPQLACDKYKRAAELFTALGDERRTMLCFHHIGSMLLGHQNDSAYHYINASFELSKELNDTVYRLANTELLAESFYNQKEYDKSRSFAMSVFRTCGDRTWQRKAGFCAAQAFGRLNEPDSAAALLKALEAPETIVDTIRWLAVEAEIKRAHGDLQGYIASSSRSFHYSDSLFIASQGAQIRDSELNYNKALLEHRLEVASLREQRQWLWIVLLGVLVLAAVGLAMVYRRQNRLLASEWNSAVTDLHNITLDQKATQSRLEQAMSEIGSLRETINAQEAHESELESTRHALELQTRSLERIRRFGSEQQQVIEIIIRQITQSKNVRKPDDGFWESVYHFVDQTYPSMLNDERYCLTPLDKQILSLHCLGIPVPIIQRLVDKGSPKTIYNAKRLIALKLSDRTNPNLQEVISGFRRELDFSEVEKVQ